MRLRWDLCIKYKLMKEFFCNAGVFGFFFADWGFAPCGAFELQEVPGGLCQLIPDTIQGLVNALNLGYPRDHSFCVPVCLSLACSAAQVSPFHIGAYGILRPLQGPSTEASSESVLI